MSSGDVSAHFVVQPWRSRQWSGRERERRAETIPKLVGYLLSPRTAPGQLQQKAWRRCPTSSEVILIAASHTGMLSAELCAVQRVTIYSDPAESFLELLLKPWSFTSTSNYPRGWDLNLGDSSRKASPTIVLWVGASGWECHKPPFQNSAHPKIFDEFWISEVGPICDELSMAPFI